VTGLEALGLASPRAALALLGLFLLSAVLLARFGPRRRRTLGRCAILLGVYLASLGLAALLGWVGSPAARGARFACAIAGLLVAINLAVILVFDLLLPAVRLPVVSIVGDLAVGAAYAVTAWFVLRSLGMEVTGLIATSAVLTAVIGFSLQPTLGNIMGGLALQLDQSIQVGDWVELEGRVQGQVREIRWRHAVLETRDWDTLVVPNAKLLVESIKVLGRREGQPLQRRMWVYFNVDFRHPPGEVIRVALEALGSARIEGVAEQPRPDCVCMDLAGDGRDSFARYAVRYWLADLLHDDSTSSGVRARVHAALSRAGIPLAVPAGTVFLSQDDPDHARRKLEREAAARRAALDAVELFGPMSAEEKGRLAERMQPALYSRGETITRQGAAADWLFVLTRGEAEVRVEGEAAQARVATVRAPTFFGEMGLMTGEPRSATVAATTEVAGYRIDRADFQETLARRPEIAREISAVLAARRVDLLAARKTVDAETRRREMDRELVRILAAVEDFFGLRG
jgi:small-conductance mechanosensitive channel